MSNIYITEPPTSGKVLLKTTVGDIDIELWAKETPKTCRNFIQLCLEGYYNNTIFHRVVKGFIAQGGDPNGDGTGGVSIYDEPFKDEFHSRLRFNRRGLLAMANAGKDDNASQFFFTLASTPELQNKHTIFGKVSGQTIFNMVKLEEGLIEDERPAYPHKIIKTEVLNNPFPDIEPRAIVKPDGQPEKPKIKQPGVKNFKLLSFGEEAEEDEEETSLANTRYAGKSKSTHDLLDDPKLSTKTSADPNGKGEPEDGEDENEEDEADLEEQLESIRAKLRADRKRPTSTYYINKDAKDERKRKAEQIREEIKKVKKEYQENKLVKEKEEENKTTIVLEKSETIKKYQEEYDKYKEKKQVIAKKGKQREDFTLQLLKKFKVKLEAARETGDESGGAAETSGTSAAAGHDSQDSNWLAHKLHFKDDAPVLAKDANTKGDDWFEIYDPRNPINRRRRGEDERKRPSD